MSLAAYRQMVGLPARPAAPQPYERAAMAALMDPAVTGVAIMPPTSKRHHALGRLPAGTMNKSEARYEREVLAPAKAAGELLWYAFEAVTLRLAPRTFLKVDFFLLTKDGKLECHDVKGARAIYEEDAKVKMKVAASAFPFVFRIAFPRRLRDGGGWDVVTVGSPGETMP